MFTQILVYYYLFKQRMRKITEKMEDIVSSSSNSTSHKKKRKLVSFNLLSKFSSSTSSSSSSFNATTTTLLLFFLFICTFVLIQWFDISSLASSTRLFTYSMLFNNNNYNYKYPKKDEYLLNCTSSNMNITCPANYPPTIYNLNFKSNETCPEYFRWIHEDLKIWKENGITREMVESLQDKGTHFRLVIVNGIAYVKQYGKAYQTRDTNTFWGILQLLKLYPGRLPDLDLVFQCEDLPAIKKDDYKGAKAAFAPPQFHFCGDDSSYDIVFPDWSYWGWPEINIKPWVPLLKDIKEGNPVKNWTSREPYAFWKGNLHNGPRRQLKKCNSTNDWSTVIFKQDWREKEAFRNSDLSKQCTHRYKLYMEGISWSVSEKYILACDSMTILINPKYYDFFTRSLIPMVHYWPANPDNLCQSIKFAVDWGNKNNQKAQEIGKAGSKFIFDQIKMENVYDYMFHLLNEYAKLLKYRPTIPEGAIELCSEKFACSPMGLEATFKKETMVNGPLKYGPCKLPPPYDPNTLEAIIDRDSKIKQVVEMWEKGIEVANLP